MAQKNAAPTREQQAALKKAGLNPLYWVVTKEFPHVHDRPQPADRGVADD